MILLDDINQEVVLKDGPLKLSYDQYFEMSFERRRSVRHCRLASIETHAKLVAIRRKRKELWYG